MGTKKVYQTPDKYESKIPRIMERLGATEYDWDYTRHGAWIQFLYKGHTYKLEHSVENARKRGINISYGSDAFAQIVLGLEDLARLSERGIYDLGTWLSAMRLLPETSSTSKREWWQEVLDLKSLEFTTMDLEMAYRDKAKIYHPDKGGSDEMFCKLQDARKCAYDFLEKNKYCQATNV